jgi:hypothetical protein
LIDRDDRPPTLPAELGREPAELIRARDVAAEQDHASDSLRAHRLANVRRHGLAGEADE